MDAQRLLELQMMMSERRFSYIKENAYYCLFQLMGTCVVDSHFAAFHITSILFPNVKNLFNSNGLFQKVMAFLNEEKYAEAKAVCVWQLKHVKIDYTEKKIGFYGSVQDHLMLFHQMFCAEMTNNQPIPIDNPVYQEILSNFNTFGHIVALGDSSDPTLILGYYVTSKPQLYIQDNYNRIFALQFLLLKTEEHVTMCFQSSKYKWHLYDNKKTKPSFQPFDLDSLNDYAICLAGYVNITQAQEYKLSIAETGEGLGTNPFNSGLANTQEDLFSHFYPQEMLELQMMMTERQFSYMKEKDDYYSYQLINTCVVSSHLAAFHITFILFPNVKNIFNSNELFRNLMASLNESKYAEAKIMCASQLKHVKTDHTRKDFYGNVHDHFVLYHQLVCAEITTHQAIVNDDPVYQEMLSSFKTFSLITALGDPTDPTLIFGYLLTDTPRMYVKYKKNRIFALQFLLLGKEEHMTMCFKSSKNKWHLYDNDATKPSFQPFDFGSLGDYMICLAGYVNITQAQEYKFGIAETGEGLGTIPIDSVPIAETGEGLGTMPIDSVPIAENGEGTGTHPFY